MNDDTDTWDMPVHFKLYEYPSGGFYIVVEQLDAPTLPILDNGFLCLEMDERSSIEDARALSKMLDEKVVRITYTGIERPEWSDNPGRGRRTRRRRPRN